MRLATWRLVRRLFLQLQQRLRQSRCAQASQRCRPLSDGAGGARIALRRAAQDRQLNPLLAVLRLTQLTRGDHNARRTRPTARVIGSDSWKHRVRLPCACPT